MFTPTKFNDKRSVEFVNLDHIKKASLGRDGLISLYDQEGDRIDTIDSRRFDSYVDGEDTPKFEKWKIVPNYDSSHYVVSLKRKGEQIIFGAKHKILAWRISDVFCIDNEEETSDFFGYPILNMRYNPSDMALVQNFGDSKTYRWLRFEERIDVEYTSEQIFLDHIQNHVEEFIED